MSPLVSIEFFYFIYIIQSFFFIPKMCPHLSLLFVLFFSFQDVSTYLYVNLLFHLYHSVIFFHPQNVSSPWFFVCFIFSLSRCLYLSLCKSFIFSSSSSIIFCNFLYPKNVSSPQSFVCVIFFS